GSRGSTGSGSLRNACSRSSCGATMAHPPPAPARSANSTGTSAAAAGDVPSVSPWTAARASVPLVGDVLGEPAHALAHVRVPVLPVVLARPLRVRAGDPPG